jgi:protein SCO1/2
MTPLTRKSGRALRQKWILWLGIVAVTIATPADAQVVLDSSAELSRVDIVDRIGAGIPLDLTFVDDHGETVRLERYFGQDKPVVLILGYYRCPMLCNLVFNGMVDGVNLLDWAPGEEYRIVTVSINPEETPDLAASKKANYLKTTTRPVSDSGWAFLVGDSSQSRALADAVGFKYFYDAERGEWAHPAAAFILTPQGKLSRVLYGIQFSGGSAVRWTV